MTAYLMEREAKAREVDDVDMYALARRLANLAFEGASGDLFRLAYDQHYGTHYDELHARMEREAMESEWASARRLENHAVEQAEEIRRRTEAERAMRALPKQATTGESDLSNVRGNDAKSAPKKEGRLIPFRRPSQP